MEIWADIPRYLGYYQASDLGRIRRCKVGGKGSVFGKVLSPGQQKNGYLMVVLSVGCKKKTERVHRLVAEAFLGYQHGMEVCHNDGNIHDNRPSNLRWDTHRGNEADKEKHGTLVFGAKHKLAKLTEDSVISILDDRRKHKDIASDHGVSRQLIGDIKSGKCWTHLSMVA